MRVGGLCPPPRHTLSRRLPSATTRGPLHRPRRVGPRSEGRCAPALRRASGPHHLVRGWAAGFDGGFRGAEQARSHTFPSPAGGDPAPRRPPLFWCAGVACACGTMRASVCATAEVLVARQHAVSEPTPLTCVHGRGRGRGGRITRLGRMERQRALVVLALRRRRPRRVGVRSGAKAARAAAPPRATRGWIGGC